MDDLISRQAAIEIIQSMYPCMPRVPWLLKNWQKQYEPYIRVEEEIKKLPSVQPDSCEFYDTESHFCAIHRPSAQPEIIRCKACKYRDADDVCTGRGYPNALVPDDGFCDKGERSEE